MAASNESIQQGIEKASKERIVHLQDLLREVKTEEALGKARANLETLGFTKEEIKEAEQELVFEDFVQVSPECGQKPKESGYIAWVWKGIKGTSSLLIGNSPKALPKTGPLSIAVPKT